MALYPEIVDVLAEPFDTPLHNPFVTSRGSATVARAVRVTVTLSNGLRAHGESVPVEYVTGETISSVLEIVNRLTPELIGQSVGEYGKLFRTIGSVAGNAPSTRCAIEMAILNAFCDSSALTVHRLLGASRWSMNTDVTIPIVANAFDLTKDAWDLGIRVFKIKVGDADKDADKARVAAIRSAAPDAVLRIDANQAFEPEEAVEFVTDLVEDGANIELLEQPVARGDFDALDWTAKHSPVPVFADESCTTVEDALKLVSHTAVQGLNLKINKNGVTGVLDIVAIARSAGKKLMLGCMLETHKSIAFSLAIACGTGAFDYIDLDSHLLLNEDLNDNDFTQIGSELIIPSY